MNFFRLDELYCCLPEALLILGSLILMVCEPAFRRIAVGHVDIVGNAADRVRARYALPGIVTMYSILSALVALLSVSGGNSLVLSGSLYSDNFGTVLSFVILCSSLAVSMFSAAGLERDGVIARVEYYILLLLATAGAVLLVKSAELITFFVVLELMSIALYALCASCTGARPERAAQSAESGIKYFILGGFSSAFLLYGIAILYGLSGSTYLSDITSAVATSNPSIVLLGLGLILIGLLFKIGAVPFQFWVPDVYQGAPNPVTAFMASVVKVAAFGALLRICWGVFGTRIALWSSTIWIVAVATIVLGNLLALRQRSVKRMLAYSSVAHAGYMICALIAPQGEFGASGAIVYYLAAYSAMTLGAFAVLQYVSIEKADDELCADDVSRFVGFSRRRPWLAAAMSFFLLALAGLPPGVSGLFGKVFIFSALLDGGFPGLAIIAILFSVVGAYYYLKVVLAIYTVPNEAEDDNDTRLGFSTAGVVCMCVAFTLLLSLYPDAVRSSAALLRP